MPFTQVFGGQNIFPSKVTELAIALTADVTLQWPLEQAVAGATVFADIMEATPDAGGRSLIMPDARRAATGQATLINNLGAFTFTVKDNAGGTIGSIPSGQVWQFYLSDNSTQAGTWRGFQFGTGASSASAAALAGAGLKAIAATLNETMLPAVAAVTPLTIVNADRATVKVWSGGAGQYNLPNPATVGTDWFFTVINGGTGTLTVTPAAGLINGAASKSFAPQDSAIIVTDGTNYYTMGFGTVAAPFFDFNSINIAGTGNFTLSGGQLNRIVYRLTGVLTGNRSVIVPNTVQQYWIDNRTTGAFTVTVKTGAGVGVVVPQGSSMILYCDGSDVFSAEGSPTGGVLGVPQGGTGLSSFNQGDLIYSSAANVLSALAKSVTATRYLANTGAANAPQWDQVDLTNGVKNRLPFANLTQGAALSVLGVTGNALADVASIAGTANQVLRVDNAGTTLAFGAVNLGAAAAITGTLGVTNGGTGLATVAQGDLLYGSAANTLASLAKDTGTYQALTNEGTSNNPAWKRPRMIVGAAANSDYTFVLNDAWTWTPHTGAAAQNWTVPDNGSVAYPIGTVLGLANDLAGGNITVKSTAGVTIDGHGNFVSGAGTFMVLPPGYKMWLIKQGTNTWMAITDAPVTAGVGAVFAGWVQAAAASSKFNSAATGWTVSNPATGTIRVTHNLGLSSATDLSVSPTLVSSADDRTIMIEYPNVNYFDVHTVDVGSGNVDVDISFVAVRLA